MDAITIAEEKLALIEAEETEQIEIGKKKTQIEELPGQLTIWDTFQTKTEEFKLWLDSILEIVSRLCIRGFVTNAISLGATKAS